MTIRTEIPPALAEVAVGRDNLTTKEFAVAVNKAEQTIRKLHCLTGEAYGIRPSKIGNQLQWSVQQIAVLLAGAKSTASESSMAMTAMSSAKIPQLLAATASNAKKGA
jgi:hypothetical protein